MNHKKAILFGVGVWAFPLVVAVMAFPLRDGERALFESIVAVALATVVILASTRYFRGSGKKTLPVGFCLGLIWLGESLVFDLAFFSWGPMKMSLVDYIKDIGATYLMIPIITSRIGYIYEQKN